MILTGNKVVLTPTLVEDAAYYPKWLADAEVCKYQFAEKRKKRSVNEQKRRLRKVLKNKDEKYFLIRTKMGKAIGTTSILVDLKNKFGDFGLMIGERSEWGMGYGTEVTRLMMNYAFQTLKLHRLQLEVFGFNKRGIAVYKRAGFKIEGKKRQAILWNGKYYDEYMMGVLESEYKRSKSKTHR